MKLLPQCSTTRGSPTLATISPHLPTPTENLPVLIGRIRAPSDDLEQARRTTTSYGAGPAPRRETCAPPYRTSHSLHPLWSAFRGRTWRHPCRSLPGTTSPSRSSPGTSKHLSWPPPPDCHQL